MPKIQAETATGLVETEAPAGKKLVLAIEDEPGEMQELERNRLAMEAELAPNTRLSCQIHVQSDLKVRVVNQASVRGMDPGPRPVDE
jgi:Na+-transporting NADH:ubiquinone oxidoreductase subunit NqrF